MTTDKNILEIKKRTLDECGNCFGKGNIPKDGKILVCSCVEKYKKYLEYYKSGIEEEYWDWEWKDLDKTFLDNNESVISDLKFVIKKPITCIRNKVRFLFLGKNGIGKNVTSYLLMKDLIKKGFKTQFLVAETLGNWFFIRDADEREDKFSRIENCDLVVVDELDKFTGKNEEVLMKLSNYLSELMKEKAIIFISNMNIEELKNLGYSNGFINRLEEAEIEEFTGTSFRKSSYSKFKSIRKEYDK